MPSSDPGPQSLSSFQRGFTTIGETPPTTHQIHCPLHQLISISCTLQGRRCFFDRYLRLYHRQLFSYFHAVNTTSETNSHTEYHLEHSQPTGSYQPVRGSRRNQPRIYIEWNMITCHDIKIQNTYGKTQLCTSTVYGPIH